ncbi:5'-methylthioadenosine/S-adenosylhomocysteine nucleosidase [Alginatibacterium sediminis]|uniref:5'-methylthioadenosine/S-adenosylhomocysteine nucleosidase n=1 Tax=Alginatibacterium sediminis TaxID=2164068 RepID=A0A420E9K9_9ALTE|nr:5'-methylthioadenosine/S-adenosylhomocysteine nucleosidase [Alginatibacterium sediminis]RKF15822.1 5'-methylthioadenosine/S-adenosylhomocysteine nucleosidase [Alginatibacterium sediminis]
MTIAIIGAMEQEVAILRDLLSGRQDYSFAGCEFYSGQLNGVDVVLTRSGIGKVAAAIATSTLIQRYQPQYVINTGSAGGFDSELKVGDVVISSEVRHHDADVTAFGYELGQLPSNPAAYIADPRLLELAKQSIEVNGAHKSKAGLICSGDSFICEPTRIAKLRQDFPSMLAVDMEAAAIAQVCHLASVPFVVIRALSDIAGTESPQSFDEFLETAAVHSSQQVQALIAKL